MDEALSELLDDLLVRVLLVEELDILSRGDLALSHDAFLVLHHLSLMIVDEGIVFADFTDHIIDLLLGCELQESLFNVEVLLLDVSGHGKVIIVLVGNKQELLDKSRGRRQSDELEDGFEAVVYFLLERSEIVLNDAEMRVTDPRVNQLLIQLLSLFDCFIPGLIVGIGIELDGALGSCDKMDDGLVPAISQLHGAPTSLVKNSLPNVFICICRAVHDPAVAKDNSRLIRGHGNLDKVVLKGHLKLHQVYLEADGLRKSHFACLDKGTTLH
jgi:hypothetical protein